MDYNNKIRDRIIKKLGRGGTINPRTDDGDVVRQMLRDGYITPPASGNLGTGHDAGSIRLTRAGRDLYADLTQKNESKRNNMKIRLSELRQIIARELGYTNQQIKQLGAHGYVSNIRL